MKCAYCGAQSEARYIYCLVCGTKLEPEEKTEPAAIENQLQTKAEDEFPKTRMILEEIFGPEEDYTPPTEEISYPAEQELEFPVEPCVSPEYDEKTDEEQPFPVYTTAPLRQDVAEPTNPEPKPEPQPVYSEPDPESEPKMSACESLPHPPVGRSLVKMVLLGLITAGIYPLVIWSRIVTEMNIAASRKDGKRTMPYCAMLMLAPVTLGIYPFVWMHHFCKRVDQQLKIRSCDYRFGASDFWLWGVLGSLILVGPFVFIHKMMKSMNLINSHYNIWG